MCAIITILLKMKISYSDFKIYKIQIVTNALHISQLNDFKYSSIRKISGLNEEGFIQ